MDGDRIAAEQIGARFHPSQFGKPMRPGISDHELKELRCRLVDAVQQVLRRCDEEGFVSEPEREEYGERLDLDNRELKRNKGR